MTRTTSTIREVRGANRASLLRRGCGLLVRLCRAPWNKLRFAKFGRRSRVDFPSFVVGAGSIEIGENVIIWRGVRLEAHFAAPEVVRIRIGDRTRIAPHVHIGAAELVSIGCECGIGSYTWITDHDHDTSDPRSSVVAHKRVIIAPTIIGDRVYIGERVAILRGVRIGEGSTIGTNSVVTSDIPPFSIAVGVPARVIRQFDPATGVWRHVDRD